MYVYPRESELFLVIRDDGVSSLFVHGKARAETRTRTGRRSHRKIAAKIVVTGTRWRQRQSGWSTTRDILVPLVEISACSLHVRQRADGSSSSGCRSSHLPPGSSRDRRPPSTPWHSKNRRILERSANPGVTLSVLPISYRSDGSSRFYRVPGSKNVQRTEPGTTHSRGRVRRTMDDRSGTRDERTSERTDGWTNGWTNGIQRTRRERTVRRLGLNLTDSVVALPASSGRDVLRSIERERDREREEHVGEQRAWERRVGNPCRGGCEALASNPSMAEAYRVPRASTIISVRQRCLASRTTQRDQVPRALLYLRGVIEPIQQYWFRAAKRSAILKNAQSTDSLPPSRYAPLCYRRARATLALVLFARYFSIPSIPLIFRSVDRAKFTHWPISQSRSFFDFCRQEYVCT